MTFTRYRQKTKNNGTKEINAYKDTCEFCGQNTTLRSYNSKKFFSLFGIPIIPLKEYRIIDECTNCKNRKIINIEKWEELKNESINQKCDMWIQQPDDIETVKELLNTILHFKDADKLNSLSNEIFNRYSDNAEVMNYLGSVFVVLNQFSKAEEAYRKSLQIEDNEETRENLAEVLMKNSKPDEAKQLIWHIVTEKDMGKIYYIYLLIESYQFIGEHIKVLKIIKDCKNAIPEMENDKKLRYYNKISEQNYYKNKSITGRLISYNAVMPKKKRLFLILKLIGVSLLILPFLIYLVIVFSIGASRDVYLVNGLDKSYTIEINGKEKVLAPYSEELIKLPEGTLDVEFLDLNAPEKNFEVEIKTPFWSKPFNKPVFIINPDRTAVMLWNKILYSEEGSQEEFEEDYSFHMGEYFYEFEKPNYLFEDHPKYIDKEEGTFTIKTQLVELTRYFISNEEYFNTFLDDAGPDMAFSYIERKLFFYPDDSLLIEKYKEYLTVENFHSFKKFCRSKFSERPVLFELHELFQEQMEIYEPSYDLEGEYKEYLENDKDNNMLCYLLGQVTEDYDEQKELFLKSIEGDNPCDYGYYELAYMMIIEGNFEEAVYYSEKALEFDPLSVEFTTAYKKSLTANKEYDLLLSVNKEHQMLYPDYFDLLYEEVLCHVAKGDIDSANNVIDSFLSRSNPNNQTTLQYFQILNRDISYFLHDYPSYISALEETASGIPSDIDKMISLFDFNFIIAFLNEDYYKAEKIASENNFDYEYYLLLYMVESDKDKANKYLNSAIENFSEDGQLIKYFSGEKEWGMEELKKIWMDPFYKRIVVLALAKTKPELKEELFEFADKLNYDLRFPHNTIEEIIEKGEF